MKILFLGCLLSASVFCANAQNQSFVVVEAESGTLGSDWNVKNESGLSYVTPKTDLLNSDYPGSAAKVITYNVKFPKGGIYDLYVRVRSGGGNDDSFFYARKLGIMNESSHNNEWVTCNGLFNKGYAITGTDIKVEGAGTTGTKVWKWINLSQYNGGDLATNFKVSDKNQEQVFQIGAREDGLDIDKFVFAPTRQSLSVNDLNKAIESK